MILGVVRGIREDVIEHPNHFRSSTRPRRRRRGVAPRPRMNRSTKFPLRFPESLLPHFLPLRLDLREVLRAIWVHPRFVDLVPIVGNHSTELERVQGFEGLNDSDEAIDRGLRGLGLDPLEELIQRREVSGDRFRRKSIQSGPIFQSRYVQAHLKCPTATEIFFLKGEGGVSVIFYQGEGKRGL